MFLKKDLYEAVGGYDEDYFMYGEDIDLSYKVLKAGYHNMYFGETTCLHFKGESTSRDREYAKRFYGAMQIFYKKHFKQNLFFNALVWLGIKLASKRRLDTELTKTQAPKSYVYATAIEQSLEVQLPHPIELSEFIFENVETGGMLVYDLNWVSAKEAIRDLKQKSKLEHIVFRFLPKNSKFIIGSDSAIHRGEVMHF
jgi:hypothetical protein